MKQQSSQSSLPGPHNMKKKSYRDYFDRYCNAMWFLIRGNGYFCITIFIFMIGLNGVCTEQM